MLSAVVAGAIIIRGFHIVVARCFVCAAHTKGWEHEVQVSCIVGLTYRIAELQVVFN